MKDVSVAGGRKDVGFDPAAFKLESLTPSTCSLLMVISAGSFGLSLAWQCEHGVFDCPEIEVEENSFWIPHILEPGSLHVDSVMAEWPHEWIVSENLHIVGIKINVGCLVGSAAVRRAKRRTSRASTTKIHSRDNLVN